MTSLDMSLVSVGRAVATVVTSVNSCAIDSIVTMSHSTLFSLFLCGKINLFLLGLGVGFSILGRSSSGLYSYCSDSWITGLIISVSSIAISVSSCAIGFSSKFRSSSFITPPSTVAPGMIVVRGG